MLDKKDKIILEALTRYCRISTLQLAKLTRLSQPTVVYRIKQLEKKYISKYDAIINHDKFLFLKEQYFIDVPLNKVKEFEKKMISNNSCTGIIKLSHKYNYYLLCYFRTKEEKIKFESKIEFDYLNYSFVDIKMKMFTRFDLPIKIKVPPVKDKELKLGKEDVKLIKLLADGRGRSSILELSEKMKTNYTTVLYKFKRLVKAGYFLQFMAQPSEEFTTQADILLFNAKNISFDEIFRKLSDIRQIPYLIKCSEDTYITQIVSHEFQEYKEVIESFRNVLDGFLVDMDVYNQEKFILANRYPFEWLLE